MENENIETIEQLKNELSDANNKYLYKLAEFENFKKRTLSEKLNLLEFQDEFLAKDILPIIDNFERALNSFVIYNDVNKSNKEGIELIYDQLIEVLSNHKINRIQIDKHDIFDDTYMNAIGVLNIPDFDDNEIVDISKSAWKLKDKIIRFADVIVNKKD